MLDDDLSFSTVRRRKLLSWAGVLGATSVSGCGQPAGDTEQQTTDEPKSETENRDLPKHSIDATVRSEDGTDSQLVRIDGEAVARAGIDQISAQYHRITGESVSGTNSDDICDDLMTWLRANEDDVRRVLEQATAEFSDLVLDDLNGVFESVWDGEDISERDIVDSTVVQQAETYEQVRELFKAADGPSPWEQLRDAKETLQDQHPDSPTTAAVETALNSSRPPTSRRVRQLIERAKDPKPSGPDDDDWAKLQSVAEELRHELPNAEVTDKVTSLVDSGQAESDEVTEALSEAKTVLQRKRGVMSTLDKLEVGSIVLIEDS